MDFIIVSVIYIIFPTGQSPTKSYIELLDEEIII